MVISQTPLRVSFLGGGTDYPAYFRGRGGETLVTTIDKYTVVSVHRITQFADYSFRIHYSQVESVKKVDEIQHPSARECLRFLGFQKGIEVHYVGDLPARTGLGSSSSATVGLLNALHRYRGETVRKEKLAEEAVHVEQKMIKERVGCQDQYACAVGGFLHLVFSPGGKVSVNPVVMPTGRLQTLKEKLLLLYTGMQRHAHEILEEQIDRTQAGENTDDLDRLKPLVREGVRILTRGRRLGDFGALLHEGWLLKRRLSSKITNPLIDEAYERARKAGAIGGKLLGAGGGGFLLLFVEPGKRSKVQRALTALREAPFSFDNSGTQIVFYRP